MRRLINRTAAVALCVTVALGSAALPCAAAEATATKATGTLTRLSPASRDVLAKGAAAAPASGLARSSEARQPQPPAAGPTAPSSFFKSTRGKVTLALMGAGVGLTLWSINHDRKPVKSPVR